MKNICNQERSIFAQSHMDVHSFHSFSLVVLVVSQGSVLASGCCFRQKFGDQDVDLAKCGIGFTCRKGLKPESPNQAGEEIRRLTLLFVAPFIERIFVLVCRVHRVSWNDH